LLCEGTITNGASSLDCCDNAPPVNGGTICFYVQLLDENGNSSPLTAVGCVDCAPSTPLPIPTLAKIRPTGNSSTPGMQISWFCPPYGVERFELLVAGLPGPPITNQYAFSSQLSSTGAPPTMLMFTNFGTNTLPPPSFYSFRTPKVGPGFGNNGAAFQINANAEIGKLYLVAVRARGKNDYAGGRSLFQTFIWGATNMVSPQVPWPARPLPYPTNTFTTFGYFLSPSNPSPVLQWSAIPGNGVLVGTATLGQTEVIVNQGPPRIFAAYDPNAALSKDAGGHSIFPCAMYRYQVPNPNFPVVSGDTIQVSPLMENIAYQIMGGGLGVPTNTIIHDPFLGASTTIDGSGHHLWLWLRDTQPQISGARYEYVLVHFNPDNHEIDQLIPSNEVDVP